MAEAVFSTWIPVEYSPDVLQRVKQMSAVEMYGQNVPMNSRQKDTPRTGGVDLDGIAQGGTYGEDTSSNDHVLLQAQKIGGAVRVAEEDLDDTLADIIDAKTTAAATSYAKIFDNSCLAVTGAPTGYVSAGGVTNWAYASLYYLLTQTNGATGYTANTNITKTATGSAITYNDLSTSLGILEGGDYFDPSNVLVIASPSYRMALRGIKDTNGRPIFNESSNGTAGGGQGTADTVFGFPIKWSLGNKTSAFPKGKPNGNPLLTFCNPDYLLKGNRSPLETMFMDGDTGLGALTDEAFLKFRARKAFIPGHENAFSILELRA